MNIDFNKITGKIKPLHGVGNAPFLGCKENWFHYMSDAGTPFSRLHDTGGAYGRNVFVDIPNIFRNWEADENDEASYDFAFTDWLLKNLEKHNVKPIYRLGVTIENQWRIKAYNIYPPKDFSKWARICEHIIRHYNEGWANGFYMDIEYWEIWNEPENGIPFKSNSLWLGTNEQYFELYEITSKHLKGLFPNIKIGGYGSSGFYGLEAERYDGDELEIQMHRLKFFDEFLTYMKEHNCPIDFYTWHSYESVNITVKYARYVRKKLDEYEFFNTESVLEEWNMNSPWNTEHEMVPLHTAKFAADSASMMCALQNEQVDIATSYQSSIAVSVFSTWIHSYTKEPYKNYYSYVAFNELYKLKNEVECITEDLCGCYAIAAANNGVGKVLITNPTEEKVVTDFKTNGKLVSAFVIDKDNDYKEMDNRYFVYNTKIKIPAESVLLLKYQF